MKKTSPPSPGPWLELEDSVSQAVATIDLLTTLVAESRESDGGRNCETVGVGIQQIGWSAMDRLKAAFDEAHSQRVLRK
jgi:hypothetical protein